MIRLLLGYIKLTFIWTLLVIPIATWKACQLALQIIADGITFKFSFFRKKDRSNMKFPEVLPGLSSRHVEVSDGTKLLVVSAGKPKKSKGLMICIHGFPESWWSWKHQMAHFRDEFEVVAFQMRGYGGSDIPKGVQNYTVERLSEDVRDIIVAMGYEKAVVMAHDWGGAIAWYVAHRFPEMVTAMVNMAGPHPRLYEDNMSLDQIAKSYYIFLFQVPWLPELWLSSFDWSIGDVMVSPPMGCVNKDALTPQDIERYKQALSTPGAITGMVNYYRGLTQNMCFPSRETSRALRRKLIMPVLCLPAEKDGALSPTLWRGTERVGTDIEVQLLRNCSHWVQLDAPDQVNKLVRDFLVKKGVL